MRRIKALQKGVRLIVDVCRESSPVTLEMDTSKGFVTFIRSIWVSDLRAPVEKEAFVAAYLDKKHRVIGTNVVSIGTLDSSLVHPREVFRPAIALGAHAVIVCHNHPSGKCWPSSQDRQVTDRLREAAFLLGINFLDHIILGKDEFYTFAQEKRLFEKVEQWTC